MTYQSCSKDENVSLINNENMKRRFLQLSSILGDNKSNLVLKVK